MARRSRPTAPSMEHDASLPFPERDEAVADEPEKAMPEAGRAGAGRAGEGRARVGGSSPAARRTCSAG